MGSEGRNYSHGKEHGLRTGGLSSFVVADIHLLGPQAQGCCCRQGTMPGARDEEDTVPASEGL